MKIRSIESMASGEEKRMKRVYVAVSTLVMLALFALSVGACTFYFNYESVSASIGTVGEIGVRVQKTHLRCTLSSMDDYVIDGEGIQILVDTAWEDLGGGLYEKWVQVSLSQEGDGFLRISKDCTKEGYKEKVLPITSHAPDGEAVWASAWDGEYPFESPEDVVSVLDVVTVGDGSLEVAGQTLALPEGVVLPDQLPGTVRVFYAEIAGRPVALLLVGDGMFVRFDYLIT